MSGMDSFTAFKYDAYVELLIYISYVKWRALRM